MRNGYPGFPKAAAGALKDEQMRRSVGNATRTIRSRRATVVDEIPDWEELRDAGRAIKANAMGCV